MLTSKFNFPHIEGGDLDGVLKYLYKRYETSKYFELVKVVSSSKFSNNY